MWRHAVSVQVVKTMLKIRANISKGHGDLEDESEEQRRQKLRLWYRSGALCSHVNM